MPAVPRLRSAGTAPPHPPGGRLAPSSRRRGLGSPSRTTSCCTSGSSPPVESRGGHPGAPPIPPGSAPRPGPRGGHLRPRPLRGRGVGRSARHTAAKPATSGGGSRCPLHTHGLKRGGQCGRQELLSRVLARSGSRSHGNKPRLTPRKESSD